MKEVSIGIDIGGTNSVYGVVDKAGNILKEGIISTKGHKKAEDFVKALHTKLSSILEELDHSIQLEGIGIGAPNGNYYNGTIEFAPNLEWKGVIPLVSLFKKYYDLPVILTNDANAAAIGEMIFGGAQNLKDFIVITLGTGLGSGLVANGNLIYGDNGFAGELGHTIVKLDGRKCGCGRTGCLETYVSATGIVRTLLKKLSDTNEPSILRDSPVNKITSEMIYDAAKKNDKVALEVFDYTGKILGIKLADAVTHTGPKTIFLLGGLAKAGDLIFKPTIKYFKEYVLSVFKDTEIRNSGLTDKNAAVLGSAALIWKNKINHHK
jgi:glucokinase